MWLPPLKCTPQVEAALSGPFLHIPDGLLYHEGRDIGTLLSDPLLKVIHGIGNARRVNFVLQVTLGKIC